MAQIEKPTVFAGNANDLPGLLVQITDWHDRNGIKAARRSSAGLVSGPRRSTYIPWPGVYRPEFTAGIVSGSRRSELRKCDSQRRTRARRRKVMVTSKPRPISSQ